MSAAAPARPLATLLAPIKGRMRAAVACQVASSALGLVPLVAVVEIGRLFLADAEPPGPGHAWALVAAAVVGAVAALAFAAAATLVSHHADNDMQLSVRRSLAQRLGSAPLGWFTAQGSGRVKKALHDDVSEVHSLVAHTLLDLASAVTVPLVALVYLFVVDWRLALVSVAVVATGVLLFARAMAGSMAKMADYAAAMNDVNAGVVEFVDGIGVVKHFGGQHRAHARFTRATDAFADFFASWSRSTMAPSVGSFLVLSAPVVTVVVTVAGTLFALQGWSAPLDVVAFALLAPALCAPMNVIGSRVQQLQAAGAAARRVTDLMALPTLPEGTARLPVGSRVVLDGVHFSYPATEEDTGNTEAVAGVDLVLEPGTVTALVGPSGAGKSTLAALLARFHDVTAGSITVGGADLRDIPTGELYRSIGFVFQDVQLLRTSIRDNIALSRPDAALREIEAAARAASIHERLAALPRGYDSVVGEDAHLSGGEAQRVSIARALLADPPVLVLDEATAFADPESEAAIQDALSALTRGRTLLVIAHRLATVTNADHIVVLDHGRVAQQGTHERLLAESGRYARLWAAQSTPDAGHDKETSR
ncbi:ABC transporter ATP-binding protein [Nocardiopsis ansamitocini]|uniref:ABC transporter ATP-binding protein n=1 Tax=Nocardiopsis ansamitocini TaxID=1670832 RepID=A0A9W6PAY5_9ACTN|nr:ABC transporter ATP-binding protein [Nocardiopsis ansamitocini]GLU50198.1 ABC transporter ATP-binding protein [Nocardiopsis ansamitocini]